MLVLARNYPNVALPTLGIWVQRMVEASREAAHPTVIAPVPWVPPVPALPDDYARFRRVPSIEESLSGFSVHHPRVLILPSSRFQAIESHLFLPPLRRLATRLHEEKPFDLIHAHFIFPDGVVAARLGRELDLPVITTEHAHWIPWMEDRPSTWRQVEAELDHIDVVTTVSKAVAQGARSLAQGRVHVEVLPNVLDDEIFTAAAGKGGYESERILFVGAVRWVKGFDVLLRAVRRVAERRPGVRLQVVGDPFYRRYKRDFENAMALARELGVQDRIDVMGSLPPAEVARAMRCAAVLAVPSRRESFSLVTVEALACGTPVVSTRCGGPEEILTRDTGRVVEPENPDALADALLDVLVNRSRFDPGVLRRHAVEGYGRAAARRRLIDLYGRVRSRSGTA